LFTLALSTLEAESKFSEALGFLLQLKSMNIAKTATVLTRVVFVFICENI
jgi:hypothetical protein